MRKYTVEEKERKISDICEWLKERATDETILFVSLLQKSSEEHDVKIKKEN